MSATTEKTRTEIEATIEATNKILESRHVRHGVIPEFSSGTSADLRINLFDEDGLNLVDMRVEAKFSEQAHLLAVADAAVQAYHAGRGHGEERGKHKAQAEMKRALGL